MQFQILINIGHIDPIISIIGVFSPPLLFTSLLVTPLVFNAAFELNHWNSSRKSTPCYQLTTKTVNCKTINKT